MDDPRDEADSLAEIDIVERLTKPALAYRRAGAFLSLWGALVAVGAAESFGKHQKIPAPSQIPIVGWLGI